MEIPRNSSLILEEKENLKKILEEKKIPCFRPLDENNDKSEKNLDKRLTIDW